MRTPTAVAATLLVAVGCSSTSSSTTDAGGAAVSYLDPRVENVLRDVSRLLGNSPGLSFRAELTFDELEVLDPESETYALVQHGGRTELAAARPGSLYVSYQDDRERREFWLHEGRATMLVPEGGVFATLDVPPTIDEGLDAFWSEAGFAPPLTDLVHSDPYALLAPNIESGSYLGLREMDGVLCHHLFLAQELVDWQLWVEAGERALPRKIVITYREEPQAPAFSAELSEWNLDPSFPADAFVFVRPQGAVEVDAIVTPIAVARGETE